MELYNEAAEAQTAREEDIRAGRLAEWETDTDEEEAEDDAGGEGQNRKKLVAIHPRSFLYRNPFYALSPLFFFLPYVNMEVAFILPFGHTFFLGVFKKFILALLGLTKDLPDRAGLRLSIGQKREIERRARDLVILPNMTIGRQQLRKQVRSWTIEECARYAVAACDCCLSMP